MAFRTVMMLPLLLVLTAAPVAAGPREQTLAGISRCAALPDDRIFLDCIYGAAQPLRARLGLPAAPDAQIRLVPSAALALPQPTPARAEISPTAKQKSGSGGMLSNLFGTDSLHMASYSFDPRGLFTVTLSDGVVWRQDPNDTDYAHWSGKAANYPVTLTSGDFGKSRLDVRGEAGSYRVERVR